MEIGIGSGLNLPLYGPEAQMLIGLEPSFGLLTLARRRASSCRAPVCLLDASAEAIPLERASVDCVLSTWTLCTIPDAPAALAEIRRVLKPGGVFFFVEHGRAPEPRIARWQDRLDRPWSRIAGGCHLNRKIDALVEENGFRILSLAHDRLFGPPTHTFLYEGAARPR